MSDKMSNSFKSYVGIEDYDLQSLNVSGDDSFSDLNPRLLTGEMVVAEAQKVLLFAPVSSNNKGKSGTLSVTNFKLSFVTTEERSREDTISQQNCLLAEYDICLSNVDMIYQIIGDKRRRLLPGSSVPDKVKGLCILCKNMKVMQFSFKFSPVDHGKTITNALLHHAFPRRHQLLFAYDYREQYYNCLQDACWYRYEHDWKNELERSRCSGWRISLANESFHLSTSMPQWLVVPVTVMDWQLTDAARHFRGSRPPVWCWGTKQGAALVRMADLLPTITERTQENTMLEHVRKSHPTRRQPLLLDLGKDLPTPRDVQTSFLKLRDLCAPDNLRQFQIQEKDFLTQLESSRWLHLISACLHKSVDAAEAMQNGSTVVLQGHVYRSENELAPVFLIFLDCVWQLTQQFPSAFEFTETFLTTLWDSAHVSIFDTFLFDCERDRLLAVTDPHNPLVLRSVWDWGEQFPEPRDVALFTNPLFTCSERRMLRPRWVLPDISLWTQCYLRWIPMLEIRGGGHPQVDLYLRMLVVEIAAIQGQMAGSSGPGDSRVADKLGVGVDATLVGSFFPFSRSGGAATAQSQLFNSFPGEHAPDSLCKKHQSTINIFVDVDCQEMQVFLHKIDDSGKILM
ncbi:Uncharacterized protein GBIM_10624 [Gryllus bimaculatus]|nr:Uncharacterized protein GBIM_10624 [Gryllus bimaculatus]